MDVRILVRKAERTDNGTYVRFWPPVTAGKSSEISDAIIVGHPREIKTGILRVLINDNDEELSEILPPIILWPSIHCKEYAELYAKYRRNI